MSNRKANPPKPPPPQPTAPTSANFLAAVRDNFVLVSAATVIFGVGWSMLFLASYLSVFDWHLLWFIQYTDVLTFGLVAVGIIGCSFLTLQAGVQTVFGAAAMEGKSKWPSIWIGISLIVLLLAFEIYATVRHGDPFFHIVTGAAALLFAVWLIYIVVGHIQSGLWPTAVRIMGISILVASTTATFGRWLGESVMETSEFDQDVYLKTETIKSAKVVIVLSRHTILLKDRMLYVVPTGDITKFETSHELITVPPAPTGTK